MNELYLQYPIRGRKFSYSIEIREHLLSRKTPYQQIDVYDTDCFGRILTLDGHVQLATLDECAYHETLVHIPMLALPNAKRALVVGGGDGGVLRELCRWNTLEKIDLVEIDVGVIDACVEVLPEVSAGTFEDPRVCVHICDAFGFVASIDEPYDLIVMDVTDVYEGEDGALSESLFTDKFHEDTKLALSEQGLLVSQADNPIFCPYSLDGLRMTLARRFAEVGVFQALVPSFGGFSAYCWASMRNQVKENWSEPPFPLRYLDELTYKLAFADIKLAISLQGGPAAT